MAREKKDIESTPKYSVSLALPLCRL